MKRITLLIICMLLIVSIAIAANDLTGNPLYFDTAAGAKTGQIVIQGIAWVSNEGTGDDIAANDDFEVTDTAGRYIAGKRATAAGDDAYFPFPLGLTVNGVIVTSLDGGVCYIYAK